MKANGLQIGRLAIDGRPSHSSEPVGYQKYHDSLSYIKSEAASRAIAFRRKSN
jgi:hypothetical protein